jgi:photoactive yellow protein
MSETPLPLSASSPNSGDPDALLRLSDAELDLLPYGVICLDATGKILRYNLAEARFARLDREQVLGKGFFTQIAPCTATPEFQGRFLRFIEPGNPAPVERFRYVFDFRFGAQEIEAELVRSSDEDQIFVCINRKRFLPPRSSVPTAVKAPLQRELDPEGERQGVLRDGREQRNLVLSPALFEALWTAWDRATPATYPQLLTDWGFGWGRVAVVDLETDALEASGKLLRELPMAKVAEAIADYVGRQGLGQLTMDFTPSRQGAFLVHIARSPFAGRGGSASRRCELVEGLLRAVMSHLAGKRLVVREACCRAQAHADGLPGASDPLGRSSEPRCSFVVASAGRDAALAQAIDASGGDVASVLRRLAEHA